MKTILFIATALAFAFTSKAQVGATAPDFTLTDINGNVVSLYADILDKGYIAIVDVSATWCPPCWAMHESHTLQDIHDAYGPYGTDQVRVVFYEADASTTMDDLNGNTSTTMGDWLAGTTYRVINESPIQLNLDIWAPLGYPTINVINPETKEIVADPWNQTNVTDFINTVNNADSGAQLDVELALSTEEIDAHVDLSVFPNPSTGFSTLSLSGFTGPVSIQVLDLLGKEVISFTTTNNSERLDFTELVTGNYILKASNETAEMTKRVNVIK